MLTMKYPLPEGFLKEETRRGYTISESMKKAWAVQMDLLQELLSVCNRHGLRVFADSGTLIGAVREKGFIPWDDDIDVAMLREDYDRLMTLSEEFRKPYFLQTISSQPYYINRHAQLHMEGTTAIRTDGKPQKHRQNIFIDIFVIDALPSSPRAFKRHYIKVRRASQRLKIVRKITHALPKPLYLWCREHTKFLSDKHRYEQYEEVVRSVKMDDRKAYGAFLCLNMTSPIRHLAGYKETIMLPFEHIMIPAPCGYDEILRLEYGDYMRPVQAPTMHGTMFFDAEKSYEEYLKRGLK